MDLPISLEDITYAENYLAQGDLATATPLLERLVELAEEYIDAECKTEEKRQYFSFDSKFERLAYRRVEKDPRELVQVEVPFDRLYSDMAFAYIRQQDYVSARNALMQAVRWDPMNCNYRLDLAELFRALEDKQEWASLSFSVLERASDGKCAARAYTNLGQYFLEPETENISAAVGCARLALRLAPNDAHTTRLLNKIHTTYPDAADESDDHVMGELALQGVPTSPSAEIAICLIMCATDAASDGDKQEATRLTVRARDLVGEEACAAIIKLVRESDAELNAERKAKREAAGSNADGAKEPCGGILDAGDRVVDLIDILLFYLEADLVDKFGDRQPPSPLFRLFLLRLLLQLLRMASFDVHVHAVEGIQFQGFVEGVDCFELQF